MARSSSPRRWPPWHWETLRGSTSAIIVWPPRGAAFDVNGELCPLRDRSGVRVSEQGWRNRITRFRAPRRCRRRRSTRAARHMPHSRDSRDSIIRRAGRVITRTLKSFYDDQMTHHAAALTYYSLMSLFPALLLAHLAARPSSGSTRGPTTRSSATCATSSRRRCSSRSTSRCAARSGRRARRRRRWSSASCWRSTARPGSSRRRGVR